MAFLSGFICGVGTIVILGAIAMWFMKEKP